MIPDEPARHLTVGDVLLGLGRLVLENVRDLGEDEVVVLKVDARGSDVQDRRVDAIRGGQLRAFDQMDIVGNKHGRCVVHLAQERHEVVDLCLARRLALAARGDQCQHPDPTHDVR